MKQKLIKVVKVSCLTIMLMLLLVIGAFLITSISYFLSSDYIGIIFFMCCVFVFLFWLIWNDILFDISNDKELK
jgi:hypothetical protein